MRQGSKRRIAVGAAWLLAIAMVQGAWGARPQPGEPAVVRSLVKHTPFRVADGAGRYVALHFVNATPAGLGEVSEFLRRAPEVAGVVHVFIVESAEAADWGAKLADDAEAVCTDPDGRFARSMNVPWSPGAATVLLVLGPDGKELFRQTGTSDGPVADFAAFALALSEKSAPPAAGDYNLPAGKRLALQGYDPVAYFTQNKALKGKPEIASTYRGITYQFASAEDRRLFAAAPDSYLPTYGGWCATAMAAKGTKVEIDPTNFEVQNGRLFLFYKNFFSNAIDDWNKHQRDIGGWDAVADANWKKLTGEEPVKPAAAPGHAGGPTGSGR